MGWELVRLGGNTDGGYLVPDDFNGVVGCISPGVSHLVNFELDLARRGVVSILYDASIESSPVENSYFRFRKKFIGSYMQTGFLPLKDTLQEFPYSEEATLVLQMDIEGSEIAALHTLDAEDLTKFRILVIEFHRVQDWTNNSLFIFFIEPLFEQLLKIFDIVHVHANNCDGEFLVDKTFYPRALEITFHHKSRAKSAKETPSLPHYLDYPNSEDAPDISLKF